MALFAIIKQSSLHTVQKTLKKFYFQNPWISTNCRCYLFAFWVIIACFPIIFYEGQNFYSKTSLFNTLSNSINESDKKHFPNYSSSPWVITKSFLHSELNILADLFTRSCGVFLFCVSSHQKFWVQVKYFISFRQMPIGDKWVEIVYLLFCFSVCRARFNCRYLLSSYRG